jgi:LytS/YehU family sensor histidine kinase
VKENIVLLPPRMAKTMPIQSFAVPIFSVPTLGDGIHHPGWGGECLGVTLRLVMGAQFWVLWNAVLIVTVIIAIAAALIMRKELDRKKEKVAYNNRLLELEAKALTSQMNPHFIYNSLSTVQHLIVLNEQQKAFDYISDFSLLMRQMLNNSRKSYVALEDEIDFLTRYMELERFRFSNSFEYEFQVEDAIKVHSHCIAPMLIQPILENAIKHGMGPKKEKGMLKIAFSFHKDILECVVDDNGAGWKKTRNTVSSMKHESTALNIIRERLNVIKSYDDHPGKLEIIDKATNGYNETGTIVKIFIPIINSL